MKNSVSGSCVEAPRAWDWGANVTTSGATATARTVDSGVVNGLAE